AGLYAPSYRGSSVALADRADVALGDLALVDAVDRDALALGEEVVHLLALVAEDAHARLGRRRRVLRAEDLPLTLGARRERRAGGVVGAREVVDRVAVLAQVQPVLARAHDARGVVLDEQRVGAVGPGGRDRLGP